MTDTGHSGSRWEPEHRRDETAELRAWQPANAQQPLVADDSAHTWQAPSQPASKRKRPLAALTAAGLVLVGGAGGFAIGSAAASTDSATTLERGTTDGSSGTQDGFPVPPGAGQLPDADGDGIPDFGGGGGRPDGDDGFVPPDGQGGTLPDGSTGSDTDDTGDPA
jgi:hypothetical protein